MGFFKISAGNDFHRGASSAYFNTGVLVSSLHPRTLVIQPISRTLPHLPPTISQPVRYSNAWRFRFIILNSKASSENSWSTMERSKRLTDSNGDSDSDSDVPLMLKRVKRPVDSGDGSGKGSGEPQEVSPPHSAPFPSDRFSLSHRRSPRRLPRSFLLIISAGWTPYTFRLSVKCRKSQTNSKDK